MFNEPETKILFAIYNLYKTEQITSGQRGELKDMLINRDSAMMKIDDESRLQERLLNLLCQSETASTVSYKLCRPQKLQISNRFLNDISQSVNQNQQSIIFRKKQ